MPEKDADVRKIEALIEIMTENDLVKIDIQHGDDRLSLRRADPRQPAAGTGPIIATVPGAIAPAGIIEGQPTQASAAPAEPEGQEYTEITAPIVGTFYEAPSPDSDPFVETGSHVDPQTVVCIIEAMKVMNEIKAEKSGAIVEKLVANGQAVEYGQALFRIKPS